MKSLWSKTAFILRRHRILWLPYLAAGILTCTLTLLRRLASDQILHWILSRRVEVESVLGGNIGSRGFDPSSMQIVRQLRSVLEWGTHYVNIGIDAVALVLTALMVGVILHGEGSALAGAGAKLHDYPKRILVYTSKAWLLLLILDVALFWPIYLPASTFHFSSRGESVLSIGLDLLGRFCFAWVMAPIALKLLRPANSAALPNPDRKIGRYVFLLISAAQFLIELLLRPVASVPGLYSSKGAYAGYYFAPLVTGLPFVFLYVAFALIADPELRDRVMPVAATPPAWLRFLMPLHFVPRREL
jgi:hypothetical protein